VSQYDNLTVGFLKPLSNYVRRVSIIFDRQKTLRNQPFIIRASSWSTAVLESGSPMDETYLEKIWVLSGPAHVTCNLLMSIFPDDFE